MKQVRERLGCYDQGLMVETDLRPKDQNVDGGVIVETELRVSDGND